MNEEKICKLVRGAQKVLKPRQTSVKIYRSPSERAKTSENGMWAKLTACESSKEAGNNERQPAEAICLGSNASIQGTLSKRYPNATISSFNISCTPANYFETFQQQEERICGNY